MRGKSRMANTRKQGTVQCDDTRATIYWTIPVEGTMRRSLISVFLFALAICLRAGVGDHAEVKGAERLFDAWIRGQIAYRGLPGIAVGVVQDQQLIWAQGFGFADVDAKTPMTPATKFRMAS